MKGGCFWAIPQDCEESAQKKKMAGCQIRPDSEKKNVTFFETRAAFSLLYINRSIIALGAQALQARRRTSRPSAISPRPQSCSRKTPRSGHHLPISLRLSRSRPVVANLKSVAPLIAREVGNEKETALVTEDVARFIDFRFTWYKILISNWPYQIALPEGCFPGIIRSPDNSACDLQEAPPVQCGRDLAERSWCPTRLYLGLLCWCEWQLI